MDDLKSDGLAAHADHISTSSSTHLTAEHRDYLIRRHGTANLDPLPDPTDEDPYNWPKWKKVVNLLMVAFHAFIALFAASCVIPAYADAAADLNISIQSASYLTSVQIAVLGGAPLFWRPLSRVYGRRPVLIVSLVGALVCSIGAANSPNYGAMIACRVLSAWFISPAAAIGSGVVAETFFREQRARYMGIWTLMVTVGIPVGPFICGFVVQRVGYRWIYYILAITNGVQALVFLAFGAESRYISGQRPRASLKLANRLGLPYRIDPEPLRFSEFYQPLLLFASPRAVIPAAAYAMVFLFSSVLTTVEIPQLFIPVFDLDPQQIGLQFIALIIGSVLGEQVGGWASDAIMTARSKQLGKRAPPEFRLWLSYFGTLLSCIGITVFLVETAHAQKGHYTVVPVVGAGIAAAGNQIVTTTLITYVVDTHSAYASDVGVFVTFVRQIWGFIGPFWLPPMFESIGLVGSVGVVLGLLVAVSFIPMGALHLAYGRGLVGRPSRA